MVPYCRRLLCLDMTAFSTLSAEWESSTVALLAVSLNRGPRYCTGKAALFIFCSPNNKVYSISVTILISNTLGKFFSYASQDIAMLPGDSEECLRSILPCDSQIIYEIHSPSSNRVRVVRFLFISPFITLSPLCAYH